MKKCGPLKTFFVSIFAMLAVSISSAQAGKHGLPFEVSPIRVVVVKSKEPGKYNFLWMFRDRSDNGRDKFFLAIGTPEEGLTLIPGSGYSSIRRLDSEMNRSLFAQNGDAEVDVQGYIFQGSLANKADDHMKISITRPSTDKNKDAQSTVQFTLIREDHPPTAIADKLKAYQERMDAESDSTLSYRKDTDEKAQEIYKKSKQWANDFNALPGTYDINRVLTHPINAGEQILLVSPRSIQDVFQYSDWQFAEVYEGSLSRGYTRVKFNPIRIGPHDSSLSLYLKDGEGILSHSTSHNLRVDRNVWHFLPSTRWLESLNNLPELTPQNSQDLVPYVAALQTTTGLDFGSIALNPTEITQQKDLALGLIEFLMPEFSSRTGNWCDIVGMQNNE